MTVSVLLVGCGRMGRALVSGWLNADHPVTVAVVEPSVEARASLPSRPELAVVDTVDAVAPGLCPEMIIFAVKPQVMDSTVPAYGPFVKKGAAVLSIAAGRTIRSFEHLLGEDAAVIRAMPNTPAAIGRGISAAVANPATGPADRQLATALLGAVGEVVWLTDEAAMDAVTAVSGSGPAYVFLLVEALTLAAIRAGLAPDLAHTLARSTVIGSAEMLSQIPDAPADLRRAVTSPGGTTAAALEILMAEGGVVDCFAAAVSAATARSRELAS